MIQLNQTLLAYDIDEQEEGAGEASLRLRPALSPASKFPLPEATAPTPPQHARIEVGVGNALLALFDQLGLGVCLVDASMQAVLVSGRALRAGAVRLRRDVVVAVLREDEAKLQSAVQAALATPGSPQGLRLGRLEQPQYTLVTAVLGEPLGSARLAAVVLLPQDQPEHAERVIQSLFSLSPAEARVAKQLADGLTPSETAERLRMRPNTLRGYMKSIFSKLDVHRQSELVRLVATTAGLMRGKREIEAPKEISSRKATPG